MLAEKIGVIGLGNAGSAVAGALAQKTTVIGFDPSLERCTHAKSVGVECVHSLEELTDRTGKIILSSNQTLIWDTLKQIDFKNEVEGYGELFNN